MSDATNQPGPEPPTGPRTTPPEPLELRTRPRRVTRINRRVLITVAGIGLALLAGLILVALDPPNWRKTAVGPELITVDRKATPDGLERLPDRAITAYPASGQLGMPRSQVWRRAFRC